MIALVCLLLAGCERGPATLPQLQARASARPNSIEDRLALADACFAREMFHDAHIQYEMALAIDDQSYDAAFGLAKVRAELGDNSRALGAAKRALALKSDSVEAAALQGKIYLAMNKPDKAADRFERTIQMDPGNKAAWESLSLAYVRADQYDKAMIAARGGVKALPDSVPARMNLALVMALQGDTRAAETVLRKAMAMDPDNPEPPLRIAELLITDDRNLQEAYDLAQESAGLDAQNGAAYAVAAIALHKLGETNRAVLELKRHVQIHHRNLRLWLLLATLAQRNGDTELARMAAGMAVRLGPRPPDEMLPDAAPVQPAPQTN